VIPRRTRSAAVSVGWSHPDTEEEFTVECSVTPGQPERGPSYSSGGEPAEPAECEILRVLDETGKERPDLIALVEADFDRIEEEAIENAEDRHVAAYEDACERRAEERREREWER
jgi:hypothetical protein